MRLAMAALALVALAGCDGRLETAFTKDPLTIMAVHRVEARLDSLSAKIDSLRAEVRR